MGTKRREFTTDITTKKNTFPTETSVSLSAKQIVSTLSIWSWTQRLKILLQNDSSKDKEMKGFMCWTSMEPVHQPVKFHFFTLLPRTCYDMFELTLQIHRRKCADIFFFSVTFSLSLFFFTILISFEIIEDIYCHFFWIEWERNCVSTVLQFAQ